MRGLVRNNLYSMESSIALACVLSAFLAVSSLFLKSPMAAPLIIAVQVFYLSLTSGHRFGRMKCQNGANMRSRCL